MPSPLPKTRKKPRPPSSIGINPDHQQAVNCPRCHSSCTKFCYYNNYSLSQPRHFCKTCRRYWTKGGALRNVPVGGGSRKTKTLISSSSYSSSKGFPSNVVDPPKLLHTLSLPALDFPLDRLAITRSNGPIRGVYDSHFHVLEGLNFPPPVVIPPKQPSAPSALAGLPDSGSPVSMMTDHNLASSVESLGRVNRDLYWKLQQQRLAALYAVSKPRDGSCFLSTSSWSVPQQENIASGTNDATSTEGGGSTGNSGLSMLE